MKLIIAVVLLSLNLLSGCESKQSPERVADLFWQQIGKSDVEAARLLATRESAPQVQVHKTRKIDHLKFAESVVYTNDDRSEAILATELDLSSSQQDGSPEQLLHLEFDTTLVQEQGEWKVDFDNTLAAMMKATLVAVGSQLRNSLMNAAETTVQLSNEVLVNTMMDMTAALQNITKEINEAARDLGESDQQQDADQAEKSAEAGAVVSQ